MSLTEPPAPVAVAVMVFTPSTSSTDAVNVVSTSVALTPFTTTVSAAAA